jgi:hypothetical protein
VFFEDIGTEAHRRGSATHVVVHPVDVVGCGKTVIAVAFAVPGSGV